MFHSHRRSCLSGDENKVLCIHYIHISFSFWNVTISKAYRVFCDKQLQFMWKTKKQLSLRAQG